MAVCPAVKIWMRGLNGLANLAEVVPIILGVDLVHRRFEQRQGVGHLGAGA